MKKRKRNLEHAGLVACCCLVVFVVVIIIFCAVSCSSRARNAELLIPEAEMTLPEEEPELARVIPPDEQQSRKELSRLLLEERLSADEVRRESFPETACKEPMWEDCDEYARMERERKAALKFYLLHTPQGEKVVSIAAAFLAFFLFLLTWGYVARTKRPKTVVKETTVKEYLPEDGVRREDLKPYIFNDYNAQLKNLYACHVQEGTKAFVLWAFDRISYTDDIRPDFKDEALRELRCGNIRTLFDYDWFVNYYSRLTVNVGETAALVGNLMEGGALATIARMDAQDPELKAFEKKSERRLRAADEIADENPEFIPGQGIDPFEESCM